jgi:hypothetical protein
MKTILFPLFFISLFAISCSVSTSKKTTKLTFNGGELFYTDSVTEAQAKALGNYLVESKFYNGDPKTVQLDKENGIIQFSMVLNDTLANSAEYQTMGVAFIDELQQNVFKGSKVEMNYCDEYMKLRKKIKGNETAVATTNTEANAVSDNQTANPFEFIAGYWLCSNITGGNVDAAQQAKDLEILQTNFSFSINEDGTFTSNFINQTDLQNPVPIKGNYTINSNQINFTNLQVNGQPNPDQKMNFEISMPTADQLQLISTSPGTEALVMSFDRQQ